ncbi:MAG: methanosis marker protein 1 [Actinomycetia bacterium]|nr:methanosis marker protein 1 [Actinomycetes bacterium]
MTAGTGTGKDPARVMRARTLDEVEAAADALLAEVGITRVADITDLDTVGVPVFQAVRPTAEDGLNTVTNGKGLTPQAARVSAIMEGIERYCSELHDRVPVTDSYAALAQSSAVLDPRRLILSAQSSWTPDTLIDWWQAQAVSHGNAAVWVPAAAVFKPFPQGADLLRPHTIGLAAGSTWEEAVLHGLFEVLEHDAIAHGQLLGLGWQVRPESLPPAAQPLLQGLADSGITVYIQAYPSAIRVPALFVVIEDTIFQDPMLVNGGASVNVDLEVSLLRALTEATQSRLSVIGGAREDLDGQSGRRAAPYEEARRHLAAWKGNREWRDFGELQPDGECLPAEPLPTVLGQLEEAGMPLVLAADLTPRGWPFAVAKVIVPGAEVAHVHQDRIGPRLIRASKEAKASA